MNFARKLALAAVAGLFGLGVVGLSAPAAHADTSWGCGGCLISHGHLKR